MNFKRCKVVMLPTNNEVIGKNGDLVKYNNLIFGGLRNNTLNTTHWKCKHLYIISDEEIQVGDWYYRDGESFVSKCDPVDGEDLKYIQTHSVFKKVIASTDPKLDLPRPSKAFIQKYVELQGINEVMVQYEKEGKAYYVSRKGFDFKDIEETLKVSRNNTITIKSIEKKNNFNRLEVIALLDKYESSGLNLEEFVDKNM